MSDHVDDIAEDILGKIAEDGDDELIESGGTPAQGVDEPEPEAHIEGEDDSDTSDGGGEEDSTAEEVEQPKKAAIEPPVSWKADAKAKFQALPPELQRYVADRESERERGISEAQRKAADAQKASDARNAEVEAERKRYAEGLGHILNVANNLDPRMTEWSKRDWAKYSAEHPLEAQSEWFTYQQHRAVLGAAQQEKARLDEISTRESRAKAHADLSEYLGDSWKDDGKRKSLQLKVRDWSKSNGFTDAEIGGIEDARAFKTVHKAMMYDELMAQQSKIADAKAKPKPSPVIRSKATDSSNSNPRADALSKRAAKTGRLDDQAAAILAKL